MGARAFFCDKNSDTNRFDPKTWFWAPKPISRLLWNIVGRELAISKIFGFFDPHHPSSTFLKFAKKGAQKWPKNRRKRQFFGVKVTPIEITYICHFPVVGKCCKLSRMLIEVGKGEKIIQIGPDAAEIAKKQPKNGLKSVRFGDFRIGFEFLRFLPFWQFLTSFALSPPSLGRFR